MPCNTCNTANKNGSSEEEKKRRKYVKQKNQMTTASEPFGRERIKECDRKLKSELNPEVSHVFCKKCKEAKR